MTGEHVDVLIVGAGLSGIGAACHLQRRCPGKTYAILEARDAIGGTWDLFRYPGIRSDSDMFTLGLLVPAVDRREGDRRRRRRSWTTSATPPASTASTDHIRFGHRVVARRLVQRRRPVDGHGRARRHRRTVELTCSFLFCCTGYYRYDEGYTPEFPGIDRFAGPVVHPQHWPDDLDYAGKRVVVIGSGATAVTLVPGDGRARPRT